MHRHLSALIWVLIALAVTLSAAGPSSPVRHEQSVTALTIVSYDADMDGNCHHGGRHDNKCIQLCCSTGLAAVFPVSGVSVPWVAVYAALDLPPDFWREGIIVQPVIGPPKLIV